MSEIYFSPYRISTITCNANIGVNINLNLNVLFDNIDIKQDCFDNKEGIVWIQFMKEGEDVSREHIQRNVGKARRIR